MIPNILLLVLGIIGVKAELEYDGRLKIRLDHALNSDITPVYKFRGEIAVRSLQSGSATLEQPFLSDVDLELLQNLAKQGEDYRLKVTVTTQDGRNEVFYTFTSACALLESSLHDILYINPDLLGNIVSVTLATKSPCSFSGNYATQSKEFETTVYIRHMETGPVPDTASYIQKLEREKEAKDRGEAKDNRSFFAKYWMYIIPVVFIVLLSSAGNPDAGGGQ